MSRADSAGSIGDQELLYRKIPVSTGWCKPSASPPVSPFAFNPRKEDTTGISLDRAQYKSIEEAATGQSREGYYIAILRVGDLREHGIEVVSDPVEGNLGHVVIPGLTYEDRKTDRCREWMKCLAHELTIEVKGPFLAGQSGRTVAGLR